MNWENFCEGIREIYEEIKDDVGGNLADYIPQLASADPNLFGISVTSLDGKVFNIGNTDTRFCIQSCSKPMIYAMILKEHGAEKVAQHIGREPSGKMFNSLDFNSENKPHNPLINAGAIMAASLVKPNERSDKRYDHIIKEWKRVLGSQEISFDNSVFLSERNTASRNYALSHLMMENGIFPNNSQIEDTLQLYFQSCSITMTTQELSKYAAILANSGKSLDDVECLIEPQIVKDVLCVMYSSGMYDYSGRWSYDIGIPAKSGVSGCIFAVIPNVCGISIFSPPLDNMGNSVKGVTFFKKLAHKFHIHIFDTVVRGLEKKKTLVKNTMKHSKLYEYCKNGQHDKLKLALDNSDSDIDLDEGDYDSRRPLHIAVEEQKLECIEILIEKGASPDVKDRWGVTPYEKAQQLDNDNIKALFNK